VPVLRRIAYFVAIGLLVVLFAFQGGSKVFALDHEVKAFTERWGYPLWFMYVIGTLELMGLVGLMLPAFRPFAALGLIGLMVGAAATHIRVGEWFALPLPLVAAALAGYVAWHDRDRVPFLRRVGQGQR
jgi:putative oxidoreductase